MKSHRLQDTFCTRDHLRRKKEVDEEEIPISFRIDGDLTLRSCVSARRREDFFHDASQLPSTSSSLQSLMHPVPDASILEFIRDSTTDVYAESYMQR